MFAFVLLIAGILASVIFLRMSDDKLQKELTEKKERHSQENHKAWERAWEERRNAYDSAKATALAEMEAQWGECTKDIFVDYSNPFLLKDRVWVFEKAEKIVIGGNTYNFEDIIGFSLLNKSKTVYTAYTTGKSQKNLGSMVVRGIAGHLIAGDTGAMVGAITADDDYEYDTEYDSEVENDYKIYVNVNSISSPTVALNIGSNEDDAYEISNLLNVIIARNKKSE